MDARAKKKYAIAGLVLVPALWGVFGDKELLDLFRARKERDNVLAEVKAIEAENAGLEEKLRLLKTDKRYIARVARTDLGMIGKDEIIYKIDAPASATAPAAAR
ncbi:MAG: septum formation initiator family protein [Deltaproteobacteria bacterium]|nr:septum formation initiator family protein [Deltaproteobacteria bacterium]